MLAAPDILEADSVQTCIRMCEPFAFLSDTLLRELAHLSVQRELGDEARAREETRRRGRAASAKLGGGGAPREPSELAARRHKAALREQL